ncbi:hypothetical protein PYCC9005_002862 [Savitreella phatthalungensis]
MAQVRRRTSKESIASSQSYPEADEAPFDHKAARLAPLRQHQSEDARQQTHASRTLTRSASTPRITNLQSFFPSQSPSVARHQTVANLMQKTSPSGNSVTSSTQTYDDEWKTANGDFDNRDTSSRSSHHSDTIGRAGLGITALIHDVDQTPRSKPISRERQNVKGDAAGGGDHVWRELQELKERMSKLESPSQENSPLRNLHLSPNAISQLSSGNGGDLAASALMDLTPRRPSDVKASAPTSAARLLARARGKLDPATAVQRQLVRAADNTIQCATDLQVELVGSRYEQSADTLCRSLAELCLQLQSSMQSSTEAVHDPLDLLRPISRSTTRSVSVGGGYDDLASIASRARSRGESLPRSHSHIRALSRANLAAARRADVHEEPPYWRPGIQDDVRSLASGRASLSARRIVAAGGGGGGGGSTIASTNGLRSSQSLRNVSAKLASSRRSEHNLPGDTALRSIHATDYDDLDVRSTFSYGRTHSRTSSLLDREPVTRAQLQARRQASLAAAPASTTAIELRHKRLHSRRDPARPPASYPRPSSTSSEHNLNVYTRSSPISAPTHDLVDGGGGGGGGSVGRDSSLVMPIARYAKAGQASE